MEQQDRYGFKWSPEDVRNLYIPIFYEGRQVGCVMRDIYKLANPKTKTYWWEDVPKLYQPDTGWVCKNPCYIIEDPISSIRVAKYAPSKCILGSSLTQQHVDFLKQQYDSITLALDADTWSHGLPCKYKDKYGLLFNTFELLYIPKDFKDMSEDELTSYIGVEDE